jgi:hypothetical protein
MFVRKDSSIVSEADAETWAASAASYANDTNKFQDLGRRKWEIEIEIRKAYDFRVWKHSRFDPDFLSPMGSRTSNVKINKRVWSCRAGSYDPALLLEYQIQALFS